jgi:trk system potassium uptake protein TrkH
MNYKSILFYLGIYSLLVSIFSILNILYSIYFNFNLDLDSYIFTFLISAITGVLFFYLGFKDYKKISLNEQLVTIILTFLFIPFLISIPYYLSIYDINFLNAYFESVSGFTTTGFSIIESVKTLDEPLLLWRASSQWLGGLLFLIFTIGTIGSKQIKIKPAYLISGGTSGRNFYNNFNYNFIKILLIYFLLTIIIIFSYKLLDMRLLDAFALSFTTVSSGGFLPVDNLSTIIETNFQTFVLSITLLIPIFNFYLLHDIFTKEFSLKNNLEDLHLLMLIILITFFFYFFVIPDEGFLNVLFSIVSSISTSGISTY